MHMKRLLRMRVPSKRGQKPVMQAKMEKRLEKRLIPVVDHVSDHVTFLAWLKILRANLSCRKDFPQSF